MAWTNQHNIELLARARKVIPGGMYGHCSTILLPEEYPQFFSRAKGFGYCWTSEALKRGVYLHPWHNMFITAAHTETDIERTLEVTDVAFMELKKRQATLEPVMKIAMAAALSEIPAL